MPVPRRLYSTNTSVLARYLLSAHVAVRRSRKDLRGAVRCGAQGACEVRAAARRARAATRKRASQHDASGGKGAGASADPAICWRACARVVVRCCCPLIFFHVCCAAARNRFRWRHPRALRLCRHASLIRVSRFRFRHFCFFAIFRCFRADALCALRAQQTHASHALSGCRHHHKTRADMI